MVRALIDKITPDITVAAMNGPLNTVVSGDRDALRILSEELDRRDISYRELQVSNGFHSPRTELILDESVGHQGESRGRQIHYRRINEDALEIALFHNGQ